MRLLCRPPQHCPHAGPGPRGKHPPPTAPTKAPRHQEALSISRRTNRILVTRKLSDSPHLPGAPSPGAIPQVGDSRGREGRKDCRDCPGTLTRHCHSSATHGTHQWDTRRWPWPRDYSGQAHALDLAEGPTCRPGPSLPSLGHRGAGLRPQPGAHGVPGPLRPQQGHGPSACVARRPALVSTAPAYFPGRNTRRARLLRSLAHRAICEGPPGVPSWAGARQRPRTAQRTRTCA